MDETPPTPAEAIATALAIALVRKGVLDVDDIDAAARGLDEKGGEVNETAAHVLRCTLIEAHAPPAAEWNAQRARDRFRVIEGGEE